MNTQTTKRMDLEVKRLIKAPRERVWQAWTSPTEIAQWFGCKDTVCTSVKSDLQIGGEFAVEMKPAAGGDGCNGVSGVYLEIHPPQKLVYTWVWKNHPAIGSGETLVTIHFAEVNGWTEIHLRHEGFVTAEIRDLHAHGWNGCFDHVEKHLNRLVLTRIFDAPAELLWKAWTNAEMLQQWFKPHPDYKVPSIRMDARIGGKYRIQTQRPDGEYFTAAGICRELVPNQRLVLTWGWEKDGGGNEFGEVEHETVLTLEFQALPNNRTKLTLTQENFASVDSRDRHEHGWTTCIEQLALFVNQ